MDLKKLTRLVPTVVSNFDWLVAIAMGIVVSILGIAKEVGSQTLAAGTLLILSLLAFAALRDRVNADALRRTLDDVRKTILTPATAEELLNDKAVTGIERVLLNTVDFNWLPEIDSARDVTIAKLRLNFTEAPSYFQAFERVLQRGGRVTIAMADPRSPAVWLRYTEEPTAITEPTSDQAMIWMRGLEDLAIEINRLKSWLDGLKARGVSTSGLSIKVLRSYPSVAYYKFDQRLYVYPYPFMGRGFYAPACLYTNSETPPHRFLIGCLSRLLECGIPLEDACDDVWEAYTHGDLADARVSAAKFQVLFESTTAPGLNS